MNATYCETLVRTNDPDRFLMSVFFPEEARRHLWSLYALNYEIAKTREVVTDTHLGLIRLQWWRDALASFYERNQVLKNEVVEGLSEAIWRYNLPREVFDHLIYGREFDLEDRQPGSLEGMCNYADFTHTPLVRLGMMMTDDSQDHHNNHPATQPVAMAYALAGLIRAVPHHLSQGRCYLPEDLMRRNDINIGTLQLGQGRDRLVPVVRAVRQKAQELLRQAGPTQNCRLLLLHKIITEQYLNKIKTLGDNALDPRLSIPPLFREVRLWLSVR